MMIRINGRIGRGKWMERVKEIRDRIGLRGGVECEKGIGGKQ